MNTKLAALLCVLLAVACGSPPREAVPDPIAPPVLPAPTQVSALTNGDAYLADLVSWGAAWWAETGELPVVLADTCDEATELCLDVSWMPVEHLATDKDIGDRTVAPRQGRRGSLRLSSEVTLYPDMPGLPKLVMAHSLGHALGRGHVDEITELMAPYRDQTPTPVCIDGEHCKPWCEP